MLIFFLFGSQVPFTQKLEHVPKADTNITYLSQSNPQNCESQFHKSKVKT